ncbi:magnesium chelatase subunit D [Yoonia sp. 208BN28-4]|uniref:magnesium chelatase subunit D n=1 Tax=Yoonia sp. 208BN28-4 TaxID=3126505 RepID=UPI0030A1BF85
MTPWERAITALRLLAVDPGLGGCVVRARVGPARSAFLEGLSHLGRTEVRLHPQMTADQLLTSVDLTATLRRGQIIEKQGLLQTKDAVFTLAMAERSDSFITTALAALRDRDADAVIVALDEGATEDEAVPAALADRLAFHIYLDDVALSDLTDIIWTPSAHKPAQALDHVTDQLVTLAVRLGITSLRAVGFALRCAKAAASLNGRTIVTADDVALAAELVLAPRATQVPQDDDTPEPPPADTDASDPAQGEPEELTAIPDDILLDAVKAALPAGLLENDGKKASVKSSGSGAGHKQIGNRRGRPLPARQGRRDPSGRIDMMATLRAAIPWQTLRKRDMPDRTGAIILPADLQTKRYEDKSDRLLIFAVDASGSAALARLNEAKGAVELLLAEAYARRDHVALIAFRGDSAEVLLPPTRSLVQTKRRLADLRGGGGTPLASGLIAAGEMAQTARRKGLSPMIIVLTDGRSNVALDGTANRATAADDAQSTARQLAALQFDAMVIDTGKRPEKALKTLSQTLNAAYVVMPRADAAGLSQAISAQMDS